MAPRRRSRVPLVSDLPVLRSGWPSGLALLDEEGLSGLELLAEEPPDGSLVVFLSEFPDVLIDSALRVAHGVAGSAVRDVRVLSPAGDRWTVAEVEDLVRSLQIFPVRRHVVVLEGVERMDRRGLDRLLMVLEEPPSPTLVIVCSDGESSLPPTIRGRASVLVELRVLSAAERVQALVAKGVVESVAEESVRLAGVLPSLAGLLSVEPSLRALAKKAFSVEAGHAGSVVRAADRLAALSTLAGVLADVRSDPGNVMVVPRRADELTPSARRLLGLLIGVWVAHRRVHLVERLLDGDAAIVMGVETELFGLDRLRDRLRVPVGFLPALLEMTVDGDLQRGRAD